MAKHFYIIGTHDESDSSWIVTRVGTEKYAYEFIEKMDQVPGLENYWVLGSDAFNNAEALEEFNKMREDPKEWQRFTKKEMEYFNKAITPTNEKGDSMNKENVKNALMLIASGFQMLSQEFGNEEVKAEETKAEAPKEEKAKRTRTTKPKDEPKAEKEDDSVFGGGPADDNQGDDFDFDFDGEEEKAKEYTVEEVRAACVSHAKKNGKDKTYEILKAFGAKTPNDISKDKYNDLMNKLAV
jgi:hypothetical protein